MMTNNLKHTTHQWCRKVNPEPDKFEDDEFKEDNKALNDQGEGKGTNSLLSFFNSLILRMSKNARTPEIKRVGH